MKNLPPEFKEKNSRRVALINKQYSVLTTEEMNRRYEDNPGWKEESDRRCKAALTAEEHAELAELEKWVEEAMRPSDEERLREINAAIEKALRPLGYDPKFDDQGRLIEESLKKPGQS